MKLSPKIYIGAMVAITVLTAAIMHLWSNHKIAAETLDTELIQASEKFLKSCIFLIFLFTYPTKLDLAIEVQKHQRRCDYRYEEPDFSRHAGY